MKIDEYKKLLEKEKSASKYHNKKVEFRGETFDSIKERDYYILLLDRQKRGEIIGLQRQKTFIIQEAFKMPDGSVIRPITYKADFYYYEYGKGWRVIDVKGGNATKTDVYKLKKKLLAYKGIYIEEV